MTKKHFIALADAIRRSQPFDDSLWTQDHLNVLADFCRSTNSQFNRERWLGYIRGENGPNGGTIKAESKPGRAHQKD